MFNVQLAKKDLGLALKFISSTVGNNSQNLGDDCISLKDLGNNTLEIFTTNSIEFSKVVIVLTTGSSGVEEQMPYVNFKRFKQMIDSISDNEYISIKGTINDIEINYGNRKKPLKLTGSTNGMIPLPNMAASNTPVTDISINKNIIAPALNRAAAIVKSDGTNAIANCMRINTNGFKVEITAVDVNLNRMYYASGMNTESNSGDVIIEVQKFKKAIGLFDDFNDLDFESNGNITKVTGTSPRTSNTIIEAEYYIRNIVGTYPGNIANMFQNVQEYAVLNKDEILSSLSRVNAIEDNTVGAGILQLTINDNNVSITKTSQYGTVEDSFDAENKIITPISENFKAKAIVDVLKGFADNGVYGSPNTFEIGKTTNSNGSYYIFREPGNNDSMYILTGYTANTNTP